ncbi:RAI1 [Sanghuangporus sanghuang]
MNSEKRKINEVRDAPRSEPPTTRRRLDGENPDNSMRITYPTGSSHGPTPAFQYPNQLITFSYSESRKLEFTNAAMKFYVHPPFNADLNYGYEHWIKRPEERGRLDGLLTACLRDEVVLERDRANVISWRGVMTKILTAPYEDRESWTLNVMCINNTLYFEEHIDNAKLKEKENMTPRHRLQSYYGYAFESYCTSSTPDSRHDPEKLANGWSGNVNTNVQWCSIVKTKLGDNRLIIGGEVDCVEGKYTGQPNTFVELKTSMVIRNPQDEARFEKKLLKFYFQSFLLGVPDIKVGFRNPAGRIVQMQSFKTVQMPRLVRGKPGAWDPNLCLQWGSQFLAFLQSAIQSWELEEPNSANGSDNHSSSSESASGRKKRAKEECVWRVTFRPGKGAEVALLDDTAIADVRNGEDRVGFLPRFYWNEISNVASEDEVNDRQVERRD